MGRGGGRSFGGGGGGYHGGGNRASSGSGSKGGEQKPVHTLVAVPLGKSGGFGYTHKRDTETYGEPWYNTWKPEQRWRLALELTSHFCPEDPKSFSCQRMLELLVDLPPQTREAHNLPHLLYPDAPINDPPLKLPEPPNPCNMWNTLLQTCRERWSHFDSEWRCAPFEGFVQQDHCSSDNQKA